MRSICVCGLRSHQFILQFGLCINLTDTVDMFNIKITILASSQHGKGQGHTLNLPDDWRSFYYVQSDINLNPDKHP